MGCGTCKTNMKTPHVTSKKVKGGNYPSVTPKKMKLICKGSGTTNPDDLQKH